jgi:phosphoribosylaminoimidazole (AIR) synthetase
LSKDAQLGEEDAYGTFIMGIGMVIAADGGDADTVIRSLEKSG